MTGASLCHGHQRSRALKGQAKRGGKPTRFRLTEEDRGKIVSGETRSLQLVALRRPPRPAAAALGEGRGVARQIDWRLTLIAAFSLWSTWVVRDDSDWMDPVVNDDITGRLARRSNDGAPRRSRPLSADVVGLLDRYSPRGRRKAQGAGSAPRQVCAPDAKVGGLINEADQARIASLAG